MKRVRNYRFNLIEILIAMGVLAIGMVAVLGLFPVGFATTRDAMAESSSADAADQMLHMLQYKLKNQIEWTALIGTDADPGSIPEYAGLGLPATPIPPTWTNNTGFVDINTAWNSSVPPDDAKWLLLEPFTAGCVIMPNDPTTVKGRYKILRFADRKLVDTDPVEVIPARTLPPENKAAGEPYYNAASDILDFEAIALVWKEHFSVGTPLNYEKAVVLNVEISWPANQPYLKRKKALYRLELFNK